MSGGTGRRWLHDALPYSDGDLDTVELQLPFQPCRNAVPGEVNYYSTITTYAVWGFRKPGLGIAQRSTIVAVLLAHAELEILRC